MPMKIATVQKVQDNAQKNQIRVSPTKKPTTSFTSNHCTQPLNIGIQLGKQGIVRYLQRYSRMKKRKTEFHRYTINVTDHLQRKKSLPVSSGFEGLVDTVLLAVGFGSTHLFLLSCSITTWLFYIVHCLYIVNCSKSLSMHDNSSGNFPWALNCEVRSQYWIAD